MFDTLVQGGQVVCEDGLAYAEVGIRNGRIAALLPRGMEADTKQMINASGKMVIPGVIDAHFHFSMPGEDAADSFGTASISAAHGGVTTVIPFVLVQAELGLGASLDRIRQEGEETSVVDFAMHCRFPSPSRELIAQVPDAISRGVTSFKVFLAYRKEGNMCDDYHLLAMADAVGREDALLMVHCEEGMFIEYLEDQLMAEGRYTPTTLLASRPSILEAGAISRVVRTARMTGCRLHVVHLSTQEGLEEILRGRARGVRVTTETCPQYLLLNDALTQELGALAKIGPPLREEADQSAMWEGLRTGAIDLIGSDHGPHLLKVKGLPDGRFAEVPWGMPGVETMLPLLYSEGVLKGRLSIERMVDVLCTNPAKVFGLYPDKGTIRVGSDADLVLLDPTVNWEITAAALHTSADFTPYESWRLQGRPAMSLLRGQVLLKDGQLQQPPGYGHFLARSLNRDNNENDHA